MGHPTAAPLFTVEDWAVAETQLEPRQLTLAETIFSLANGYIGTRGTFEEGIEGNPTSMEGTYLNGLFLRQPIHYEENAFGLATHNHKMIQVPDGKEIRVEINGERFDPSTEECVRHERRLSFQQGVLKRTTHWRMPNGCELEIRSARLVSHEDLHAMAIRFEVVPLNFSGEIRLNSWLDAAYGRQHVKDEDDPRAGHLSIADSLDLVDARHSPEELSFLHWIRGGEQLIGSACRHRCSHAQAAIGSDINESHNSMVVHFKAELEQGEALVLEKFISYADGLVEEKEAIRDRLSQTLEHQLHKGFNAMAGEQATALERFWQQADVIIEGDPALQQGIRFNLFHIYQSTGKDGRRAIGAKGLSGPGYDGHYFWDTEIYIIPFYVYNTPEIARALLQYRVRLLDASRQRARQMGHAIGALYAWRTIGGEECSAFFPAGSAQYHINAAIAYATRQYLEATGDWHFMREGGAEMMLETARIWADMGHFSEEHDGQFCINEVTGPDEYSAMADNNFYTNAMARMHLRFAVEVAKRMKEEDGVSYAALAAKINLHEEELAFWQHAADAMYLPFNEARQIHPQDDGFLSKPAWDFGGTPPENYPLLLHYHPLVIYRHQVLKQADVVLAMALLGHEFPAGIRRNNLDFYTSITTHDSTLSTCIYSIESSRNGKPAEAYRFFEETARMDLENRHHNTEYGLHTACMAGSWMNIAMGFAGMEVYDHALHFAPHLPEKWNGYRFQVRFKSRNLMVTVGAHEVSFTLLDGEALTCYCYGELMDLDAQNSVTVELQSHVEAA